MLPSIEKKGNPKDKKEDFVLLKGGKTLKRVLQV
jgi:hypothetical protein